MWHGDYRKLQNVLRLHNSHTARKGSKRMIKWKVDMISVWNVKCESYRISPELLGQQLDYLDVLGTDNRIQLN
jgi:hypothetical protein